MASPVASPPSSPLLPPTLPPSGPICAYGQRLAYTYFDHPTLIKPEELNQNQDSHHFFTVDDQLVYLSFFKDRGPLNAACLYRFCLHVHTLLEDPLLKTKRIILYSSSEPDKKANAALLIALYAMIVMRWSPADVLHPIAELELQPYRDAGYSRADYHLSLQSTLFGISRAINLRLLDLSAFDLAAYECFEKVENGDWNWLTPGFVAFASPSEPGWSATTPFPNASDMISTAPPSTSSNAKGKAVDRENGEPRKLNLAFKNVLEEFEKAGVKAVVRLNKKLYDKRHFEARGIEHHEMYFDDGTNPTLSMTRDFIALSERVFASGGSVAVHCKAGLGRTGTLIGAWLIYKHGFTASEAIGFMRLMRPGSCVGPQQHYLYENQMTYIRWSAIDAHLATHVPSPLATHLSPTPSSSTLPVPSSPRKLPPPPTQNDRPLTPPNEADLAQSRSSRHTTPQQHPTTPPPAPPRTPSASTSIVPGQPRKTPGKSKHSVARPERREEVEVEVEAEDLGEREDLMLVKEEGGDDEAEEDRMQGVLGTPVPVERPVLALSGNGRVNGSNDGLVNGVGGTGDGSGRTAKVGRVGVTTQAVNGGTGSTTATGGRYQLRGSGGSALEPTVTNATVTITTTSNSTSNSSSTTTSKPNSTTTTTTSKTVMNPSPSRLPTRIGAKRRGGAAVVVGTAAGRTGRKRKSTGAGGDA